MIAADETDARPADPLMRLADLVICLFLLPLLLLPLILVAGAIVVDDGSPVLFRQTRVGRRCKPFQILKFRTMRSDPDRASGAVEDGTDLVAERAKFQTARMNDPRITRIGRLLRKTHLDELPQILNVLKGDMSLVGVRPDVPVQEVDYIPQDWRLRHVLRPGITGLAQVDMAAHSSVDRRTEMDLKWVRTRSFGLYLSILRRTAGKVLKRSGV